MARVRRQRGEAKADAELARIDALTGLHNRRALEEALPIAVSIHRRHNRAAVGARRRPGRLQGHQRHLRPPGRRRHAAQGRAVSLTAALRLSDPCFRWGGDEFVALLPEAGFGEAPDIAARVRETVALSCRTPDGKPVRITVGAAQLGPGETGEDLSRRADAALLEGKAAPQAPARRRS